MTTNLPLELLSANTPLGVVRHLVNVEAPTADTLCGKNTGINPRHLFIGTWHTAVGPAEEVTCRICERIARGEHWGEGPSTERGAP